MGNFNEDAYSDIVVGAPGANWPPPDDNDGGRVYVFMGDDRAGPLDIHPTHRNDKYTSGRENDQLGFAVAGAGDFDGDGWDDFIAGSPYARDYSDPDDRYPGKIEIHSNHGRLLSLFGRREVDAFGFSVAGVGDFNGDSHDDIVVGAPKLNARSISLTGLKKEI